MRKEVLCLLMLGVLFLVTTGTTRAEQVWREAEIASSMTAPLQIEDDAGASAGQYIVVAAGNNSSGNPPSTGVAKYNIRLKEGGVYRMYLRVLCSPDVDGDSSDSCWVRIQGAALNISVSANNWINDNNIDNGVATATQWFWKQVGHYAAYPGNDYIEFTMTPGSYTVEIAYREDGLWIDGFLVTNEEVTTASLPAAIPFVPENISITPQPTNGASDVPREVVLSWTPSFFARTHDVYMGTSFDDVNTATTSSPLLVSTGKNTTTYDPPGRLTFGTTYYWRVDDVNAAANPSVSKGSVWSFSVEPVSYPVTNVNATASGTGKPENGPEKTVDGSGLDPSTDGHGMASEHGWVSAAGAPQWIRYELPDVCKLDKMLVWNSNQGMEGFLGLGAKNVSIEHSLDGAAWTTLGAFEFARAPGAAGYKANTTVDFAGAVAKFVKLTISSNWGGLLPQFGLSEVRFYSIPVLAREPEPTPDTANLHPRVAMSWRAGREAGSHELYIGTDQQAVADGSIAPLKPALPAYDFAANLGQTYYWKVVEVNQAQNPAAWAGPVWSFSTATSIALDDFESYTNMSPKRVFQTWTDGLGFSADTFFPNGGAGNGTGSAAGYDPAAGDIMETALFYGGQQSMPLYYDNSAAPRISEAIRTLDPAKDTTDWSKHGLTTLVVWFRGDPANGAAPLYVKINNTKKLYNNGAAATTTGIWKPFQIDLASIPAADLKAVKTITIGVGDGSAGGTGTLLIDDIRLYATAPAVAVPTDPGTNGLQALYSMEGNVQDSSGKGRNGTANGTPAYVDGPAGYGQALAFDGIDDYVDLAIGDLVNTLGGSTFAARVDFGGGAGSWQRVFDFGSGTSKYLFLSPRQGTTGAMRTAITINSNAAGAEQAVNGPATLPSGWHHVAVVLDDAAMRIRLYMDGVEVASNATTVLPKDMGVTTQNRLGDSQWADDAFFLGSIDDFRIYSRPLSEGEIRYLAGDR